jgi:hypothetical protein
VEDLATLVLLPIHPLVLKWPLFGSLLDILCVVLELVDWTVSLPGEQVVPSEETPSKASTGRLLKLSEESLNFLHPLPDVRNKTHESISKAKSFTCAQGCAINVDLISSTSSRKSALVYPLLLLVGVGIYSLSRLTIEVKGSSLSRLSIDKAES